MTNYKRLYAQTYGITWDADGSPIEHITKDTMAWIG